jgi:NADH-quinone oxidoreductase subunit J
VMLLVIITAAMYGGVQRWGGRYFLASTLVFLAAAGGSAS